MKTAIITESDFADCIRKYDSKKTIFMIDAPWDKPRYKQPFLNFNRNSIKEYDEEIVKLCKNMKGKFIIASRKENRIFLKSGFKHHLVKSIYVLSGHYPRVLMTTNIGMKK